MSFLSNGSSHQTLSGRLDEQLHQYPHHNGNDCHTESEHREDNSVKPCFDAVKSRNDGSHLTLKPSKTSGYIVRPTGYFHFPPLTRILRSYWSMILLYQFPCNNPDRPHPFPHHSRAPTRAEGAPWRKSIPRGEAAHPVVDPPQAGGPRRVERGMAPHCQSVTPPPTPRAP